MSTPRDYYQWLAVAFLAIVLVGIVARRSGLLKVDGRFTYWNLAAYCIDAPDNNPRCIQWERGQ